MEAIEIELDSKVVFYWAGGIHCSNSAHDALILDCRFHCEVVRRLEDSFQVDKKVWKDFSLKWI